MNISAINTGFKKLNEQIKDIKNDVLISDCYGQALHWLWI